MSTIKNIPMFWWLKPYIIDKGYNVGHGLFSVGHIIWLFIIAIVSFLLAKYYKNANENKRQNVRRICATLIFLLEYIKLVMVQLMYPAYIDQYTPIHLCSFIGIFIIFDAIYPNNKIFKYWWLYLCLICGLLGVISPSTTYPYFNFFCIHEFMFHGTLVIYSVCKIASGESPVSYKGMWLSSIFPILLIIPIYWVDTTFNKGYMFLTTPADFPFTQFLWDVFTPIFGKAGYIASLILIGVIVFHLIHFIALLLTKKKRTNKKRKRRKKKM